MLSGNISNLLNGGTFSLTCFGFFEVQTKRPFPMSFLSA
ncbi:hypothetical protein CUZ94_2369 [Enterococcus faecium]|nr:hypothetical protein [Enterococcus faecium]MBK4878813.1 hypothetical protein [Enterococcus faecium]